MLPHLLPEQIRAARYLFLSHSHENQSGALPYLLANGFTGRVVLTTETARQLPLGIDDPLVLEGLSVPYAEAQIPGGLTLTWGRSGHCSGSVWYRMAENGRSLFFSGDYYDCARVHARDPIEGIRANLAVLDCDYGMQPGSASRDAQVDALILDSAHGHSQNILNAVSKVKAAFPNVSLIAGNIATASAACRIE